VGKKSGVGGLLEEKRSFLDELNLNDGCRKLIRTVPELSCSTV